jgi:putative Holliday junction resolvase
MEVAGRLLAVDLGTRRVGLAVSDEMGVLATPKPPIILQGGTDPEILDKVCQAAVDCDAVEVVVGLPLNLNGSRGPMAERAEQFAARLEQKLGRPVRLFDERLSTREAESRLIGQGMRRGRRRDHVDGAAAALFLEAYLSRQRRKSDLSGTE